MFLHEKIIRALIPIQREHDLLKNEIVAEMAMVMNILLTFNEENIEKLADFLKDDDEYTP